MMKDNWFSKLDKKKVIKGFTLAWGLILIVVMTITNIGFNEEFDFRSWLGNTLIILGIIVFGLFMGESVGEDTQKERIGGLYQNALSEFEKIILALEGLLMYFMQFFGWFSVQELFDKKVNYLIMNNITQTNAKKIIKYCSIIDVELLLLKPIEKIDEETGETIRIGRINVEQEEAIRKVLLGHIKLDASNPSYYLSAHGRSNSKSVLEQGKHLDDLIKFNKWTNRGIKLAMSLLIAIVLGFLTVKDFMSGDDIQAWVNLVMRISALLTSFLSGWLSAVQDVKLKSLQITNKVIVLKLFKNAYESKIFIPLNEEEIIAQEISVITHDEKYISEESLEEHDTVEREENDHE
ncbi:MAG: hypothetical protein M0P09_02670 [Acholeplasmataceae bacterium]|nr:hypothetical protein [Acholeplasmataceae bacterium]